MGDIKSALDALIQPIRVEAPSIKNAPIMKNEQIVKTPKRTNAEVLADARAKREANRQEKLKNAPESKTVYKKTQISNDQMQKLNYLDSIISKLDMIEDKLKYKEPIKVKEDEPLKTEKEPDEIKPPEQKQAEQNLEDKNPLKIDDRIKPEDTIKEPDIHKKFEGYNVRRYTSLREVPLIKKKKY